jgi:hypothetical protein
VKRSPPKPKPTWKRLKRSSGLKRKTKLRRKSKSAYRTLIDKADRALQDWYRAKYPEHPCESCGKPFDIVHHYIEKSRSAGLRFEEANLIFLCHGCHALHHRFGDISVSTRIILKRGHDWLRDLEMTRLARKNYTISTQYLQEQVNKYAL